MTQFYIEHRSTPDSSWGLYDDEDTVHHTLVDAIDNIKSEQRWDKENGFSDDYRVRDNKGDVVETFLVDREPVRKVSYGKTLYRIEMRIDNWVDGEWERYGYQEFDTSESALDFIGEEQKNDHNAGIRDWSYRVVRDTIGEVVAEVSRV